MIDIEKRIVSIETSLRWHKRLILALYGLLGVFLLSLLSKVTITGFSSINVMEVNTMDWQPFLIVGAALLRSVLGWAKASFADGFIQEYEIKKLGETIMRVGLLGLIVAFFPWFTLTWVEVSAVALAGDVLLNLVRKIRASKPDEA